MSVINSVMGFVENVVAPFAAKVSGQRHINAVKDGFVATMPFLIVGSLLLVFAFPPPGDNFFLNGWSSLLEMVGQENVLIPYNVSMGIFALYAAFSVGFNLAESYGLRALNSGLLSMFTFILAVAPVQSVEGIGGMMPIGFMGGTGAFTALLAGLFVPELQRFLRDKNIRLKLPDAVPEKISASFDVLIPIMILSVLITGINIVLAGYDLTIPAAVMELFRPLVSASDSFLACLLAVTLIQLLWFAGIHGGVVVVGIIGPILLINLGMNQDALAAGTEIPKIFVNPIIDFFIFVGGAGGTWGFVVLMMRSKATHLNVIGKMSIIPGSFNINEPVIFGTPIVMNPIYFIPWMLSPMVNTCIVWLSFKTEFVSKIVAIPPWTMPAPIGAVMATNSSTAAILVGVCVIVSMIIFYPFFKMHEKQLLIEEQANTEEAPNAEPAKA
ncbi:PTS sugar transporter subunit IIC [Photobacterium alginatilyticum]|uniref:PTS sugar transporter subunit IIC n=1 Tax=Photobacterium TaxID=657 RepID=UPI001EF4B1F8|nr:PTS transporter subunit EIIC [Photobacterium sp. OFAV2-7]MCG7586864.1 PTS transporter subunit EIIC [Photobacterium sp. OFAV2-7]